MPRASMPRALREGRGDSRDAADLPSAARASIARGRKAGDPTAQSRIEGRAARDRSDPDRRDGRADPGPEVAPKVPGTVRPVQVGSGRAVLARAASVRMARVRVGSGPMGQGRRVRAPAASAPAVFVPTVLGPMARAPLSMAVRRTARAERLAPPGESGNPTPRGLPNRHDHRAAPEGPDPGLAAGAPNTALAPATARVPASRPRVHSARAQAWVRTQGKTRTATCRANRPATTGPRRGRTHGRADLPAHDAVAPRPHARVSAPALGRVVPASVSAPALPRAPRPGKSRKIVAR